MRKWICMFLAALLLAGCIAPEAQTEGGHTFTDDLGRSVTVHNPRRVACLLGSFADVWVLAGGTVVAAPDDAWEDFDLPLEGAVNLGNTKTLSMEALFSAEPDFVIASTNTRVDLEWMDTLEAAGIPTAYFDVSDFDDYLRLLKLCTDITGRSDLYQQNGLGVQAQIDAAVAASKQRLESEEAPKVLYLRASAASIRAKGSDGNVLGEMLRSLGCVNIADVNDSLLENLSVEHIALEDPDFIFFVQLGDDETGTRENVERFFAENPLWQTLTAVQEGRVYFLDKRLYNMKPNDRWGEAYEALEAILRHEA